LLKLSACSTAAALLSVILAGCGAETPPAALPPKPDVVTVPSSQPVDTVAELSTLKISRRQLDDLLYEAYGLRMTFDLVELGIAKNTLADLHQTLTPEDVQRERQLILAKICGDAAPSDYENLFNQFLQQERLSRAEFDIKIVQTNAALRKIKEPYIRGKLTDDMVHRGFEQLYGAKRKIADITVENVEQAEEARKLAQTEPFENVALQLSLDRETARQGGEWPAFSAQTPDNIVPTVIRDAAFSMNKGQISDILQAGGKYHVIKLVDVIEPKIIKYDDVKDSVRKQMEDQLLEIEIKNLRKLLTQKAEMQIQFDDPVLKAEWDQTVAKQAVDSAGSQSALQKMNEHLQHTTTAPATTP
jgi:parvulin-like peptidyl-prolyl isomerase